jgi:hypothetical protein
MSRTRLAAAAMCLSVAWLTGGCSRPDHGGPGDRAPTADSMRAAAGRPAAVVNAKLEPGALETVQTVPVERWRGPGGQPFEVASRTAASQAGHSRRFGSITRETALRIRTLEQYPCSSCHLGRKVVMADKRVGDAHQNIRPVHPKGTGALCRTCHAGENLELLALESGERATLDHSYRLCAQCHFEQVNAWANGGHGKRLDGWQGRRVVMACTDCHDPHNPTLEPRAPFRAPQIERTRSHTK